MSEHPITSKELGLLPCPFCRAAADFEEVKGAVGEEIHWSVGCGGATCIGFQSMATFARKCEAAAAWNKRASHEPPCDHADVRASSDGTRYCNNCGRDIEKPHKCADWSLTGEGTCSACGKPMQSASAPPPYDAQQLKAGDSVLWGETPGTIHVDRPSVLVGLRNGEMHWLPIKSLTPTKGA